MDFNPGIFREYDIRGISEKDFDTDFVINLGKAYGTKLKGHIPDRQLCISVGRDNRKTGENYQKALIEGLLSTGLNIIDIGMVTTPVLYWSIYNQKTDGAIMVSASHNPSEYNGFKISIGKKSIHGEEIQDLRRIIEKGEFSLCETQGSLSNINLIEEYLVDIAKQFNLSKKYKIVVDSGNATGGITAPELYRRIGCEVTELFCELDGDFPNHHPDPTEAKNLVHLIEKMNTGEFDLGLAFDGDSDRIGAVTKSGRIIYGDEMMVLFSRQVLKNHPGATIISEVKSSDRLYDDIKKHGGNGIMYKTGHSLIKAKMKETDAKLAGEMSGHMFFADRFYGFDDAVYAGARLIEIIDENGKTIEEMLSDLPHAFNTPELRMDVADSIKFNVVEKLLPEFKEKYDVNDIDGVRVRFENGWGLVRASNTQPALVLRFEATNEDDLKSYQDLVETRVSEIVRELSGT